MPAKAEMSEGKGDHPLLHQGLVALAMRGTRHSHGPQDLAVGAPGEDGSASAVNVCYVRSGALPGTSQVLQQASPRELGPVLRWATTTTKAT